MRSRVPEELIRAVRRRELLRDGIDHVRAARERSPLVVIAVLNLRRSPTALHTEIQRRLPG